MKKSKKILQETSNRKEYNRARKDYLSKVGKINCPHCPYHRVENYTGRGYHGSKRAPYPNWKLVSKNRKQWQKKPIKKEIYKTYSVYKGRFLGVREWISIEFKGNSY